MTTLSSSSLTPEEVPPQGSCDSAIHVFGDPVIYPRRNPRYEHPVATLADARSWLADIHIDRIVIVLPTPYVTDNRLLYDVLRSAPQSSVRGVALIDDSVSDAELERLHEAGVRGIRFIFWAEAGLRVDLDVFRRSIERVQRFGWHVKVFTTLDELDDVFPYLVDLKVPMVFDHLGHTLAAQGMSHPGFAKVLELLKRDNWWIGLGAGNRFSALGPPWDDMVEIGATLYRAAPDRCIWATDWPLTNIKTRPPAVDLLRLLYRYLPDEKARTQVLVDNPARLYGFD
jgi:2-pyrone-4,6-dicarboxylate lactonase